MNRAPLRKDDVNEQTSVICHERYAPRTMTSRTGKYMAVSWLFSQPQTLEDLALMDRVRAGTRLDGSPIHPSPQVLTPTVMLLPVMPPEFPHAPIRLQHVEHFCRSVAAARLKLWISPLEKVLDQVRGRRLRRSRLMGEFDFEAARELMGIFNWLRHHLFVTREEPLFDALVLLNFFAHAGWYPYLIIGVSLDSRELRCWVQEGTVVFDVSVKTLRGYRPVIAV